MEIVAGCWNELGSQELPNLYVGSAIHLQLSCLLYASLLLGLLFRLEDETMCFQNIG
jgi:hypothetical protein